MLSPRLLTVGSSVCLAAQRSGNVIDLRLICAMSGYVTPAAGCCRFSRRVRKLLMSRVAVPGRLAQSIELAASSSERFQRFPRRRCHSRQAYCQLPLRFLPEDFAHDRAARSPRSLSQPRVVLVLIHSIMFPAFVPAFSSASLSQLSSIVRPTILPP